jgi:hypothetical protein
MRVDLGSRSSRRFVRPGNMETFDSVPPLPRARRVLGKGGRSSILRRWPTLAAGLLVGFLLMAGPATAQQRMSLAGYVQWISGSTMQLMADNGISVRVDLQRADQASYNTIRGGDRVRVFGYVNPDRSRLIAERIDRSEAPNVYDSYSPYPQAP